MTSVQLPYGTPTDVTGLGTVTWNFVSNPKAGLATGQQSHWLVMDHFGFAIPSDKIIDGIQLDLIRGTNVASPAHDAAVRVVKGGVIGSVDQSKPGIVLDILGTTTTYGGPTDLWGTTWTPADVNAANFGCAYSAVNPGTATTVRMIGGPPAGKITVYYSDPPTSTVPLNEADGIRLGSSVVDRVMLGMTEVWAPPVLVWTPASLSGLKMWFDASQLAGADGSDVNPWPNLANPGLPGAMVDDTTTVVAPKIKAAGRNGLNTVWFSLQEGRMRVFGTGITLDWTLVYVARMRPTNTVGRIVNGIYPEGGNILWGFWNGYEDVAYDNGFMSPNTQTAVTANWHLYSADGAAGTPNTSRLFSDGVLLGSTPTSLGWGGTFAISGYNASDTQETCDCEVAEVVMYDHRLSDTDRQTVEDYLRAKWFPPLLDPATSAYLAATGLDASYASALDGLVTGLKSAGLWTKMNAIYPFIGGTAALHKWNLKDPRDLDAAYRLTFTGGAHSGALGYRPNAQGAVSSGGYADTHLVPLGLLAQNSTHLAYYSLADVPAISRCEMGCFNWTGTSASRFHIIARYGPTMYYYGMSEEGTSNVNVSTSSGLFVATRTASNDQTAYQNGTRLVTSNTNPSIGLPPSSVWVGGINSFVDRSDLPCGFASVGSGLTDADVANLQTVVQAYETALGRAV